MKTLYRVEVIVYEIDVDDNGDEQVQDVPFEEDVCEFEDAHRAQMFATALWQGGKA